MSADLNTINSFIWDLGGVIYPYSQKYLDESVIAASKMAQDLIPQLTFNDALELSKLSRLKYKSSCRLFIKEYNLDEIVVLQAFQSHLHLNFIQPVSDEFKSYLTLCNVKHSILTHANLELCSRAINKLSLSDFFKEEYMVTTEDILPYKKSESLIPFLLAIDRLSTIPIKSIMIEDTQDNLKIAKKIGMTTVLVRPQKNFTQAEYTDYVFNEPIEFIYYFINARKVAP